MSGKNGLPVKHNEEERSKEFQELLSEVDKLKENMRSERSKNADADREETRSAIPLYS